MKKQYVGSVRAGDKVDDVFVLYEKNLAQKKDGSDYLNNTLAATAGYTLALLGAHPNSIN